MYTPIKGPLAGPWSHGILRGILLGILLEPNFDLVFVWPLGPRWIFRLQLSGNVCSFRSIVWGLGGYLGLQLSGIRSGLFVCSSGTTRYTEASVDVYYCFCFGPQRKQKLVLLGGVRFFLFLPSVEWYRGCSCQVLCEFVFACFFGSHRILWLQLPAIVCSCHLLFRRLEGY